MLSKLINFHICLYINANFYIQFLLRFLIQHISVQCFCHLNMYKSKIFYFYSTTIVKWPGLLYYYGPVSLTQSNVFLE